MKNLDFKRISAQNFLCFGSDGVEFNFDNFSNIVLIRGNNLDIKEIDDKVASNGVGKSSIPEIIVYGLFGKTIKNPKKITHEDVVNNKIGKNLKIEVVWGDYRVVRTRKPHSLRIWEDPKNEWGDETEITLGGIPATQKLIEEKIGLNYETFVNVLVFTDNNAGSFLECDASSKREIVENLLSLDKYRNFAEKAKDLKKEKKDLLKSVLFEYDNVLSQTKQLENRLNVSKDQEKQWQKQKKEEILELRQKINLLNKELQIADVSGELTSYLEAQKELENLNKDLQEEENKQNEIEEALSLAKTKINDKERNKNSLQIKLDNIENDLDKIDDQINDCKKEINRLEKNKGSKCKFCFGEISEKNYKNYVDQILEKIKEFEDNKEKVLENKNNVCSEIEQEDKILIKLKSAVGSAKTNYDNIIKKIAQKRKKIQELNKIDKPKNKDVSAKIIEEKINNINEQIINKEKELEVSPFVKIIESVNKDLEENLKLTEEKKQKIEEIEKDIPYYDFWVTAFGDSGIRKFVIDGIIPALNSRIAYWLQFLIDGKIKLEFNNELEEKIERNPADGDPFVYHAMSGGERRRLNLAVSQAFAYIMSLSSGVCPSIVFLDEVTTNIDPIGVQGVYNMIAEMSKDRKVFITTHDQNLLDLLEGCDLIRLEKFEGFTKIKK
jgi:DNA repair exonuclease SbcCD ATPase subunit